MSSVNIKKTNHLRGRAALSGMALMAALSLALVSVGCSDVISNQPKELGSMQLGDHASGLKMPGGSRSGNVAVSLVKDHFEKKISWVGAMALFAKPVEKDPFLMLGDPKAYDGVSYATT